MCIRGQRDEVSAPYNRDMQFDTLATNALAGIFAVGTATFIWLRRRSLQAAQAPVIDRPPLALSRRRMRLDATVWQGIQEVQR